MRITTRFFGFLVLGVLGAWLLGACGGGTAPATPTAAPTATPSPTMPPQPTAEPPTATPALSPTPTPFPLAERVRQLQEALRRHDVQALAALMSESVKTGFYGTDYSWEVKATQMAATLVDGAPTSALPCWAVSHTPQATEVVLGGFHYEGGRPWLWRLASGDVEAVLFFYEDHPPYRITAVLPLTEGDRAFFQGLACESMDVQASVYPTPLPTPTPAPRFCPDSPPPQLTVGEYAYVAFSPPLPNRVRNIPAKQGEVLDRAKPGESMKVLFGPVCRDGWTWWKVRLNRSGIVGWTAEGSGDVYWLKPCHTLAECP